MVLLIKLYFFDITVPLPRLAPEKGLPIITWEILSMAER